MKAIIAAISPPQDKCATLISHPLRYLITNVCMCLPCKTEDCAGVSSSTSISEQAKANISQMLADHVTTFEIYHEERYDM